MSAIPAPAPSRFLGILIDETLPSDLRYAFELLESKDPKLFFTGLKILASIFESNDDKNKQEWAGKVLSMLCRVMPSYVKMKGDAYELNKTKIDDAISQGKHPLDLKRTLETERKLIQADQASSDQSDFVTEQPTGIIMTAPPNNQDDDIKIISIDDQQEIEKSIATSVIEDIIAPGEEDVDEVPELEPVLEKTSASADSDNVEMEKELVEPPARANTERLEFEEPRSEEENEDEWVSTSDFKSWIDEQVIFDSDGNVSKQLKKGLNLMNPVDHEAEIDMNYSSSKGYHDPYRPQQTYPCPDDVPSYQETESIDEYPPLGITGMEIKTGIEVGNQECGFGDGSIDPSETNVYVCSNCQTPFHEGCGKIVLEFQGGHCPTCNHPW